MTNSNNKDKKTLIWLPFAGGNQYSFTSLSKKLSPYFDCKSVELPGRGKRIRTPLLHDMESIVDDLFEQMKDWINTPYILFGHSMGCLSAFLLVHKIKNKELSLPVHLFLSSAKAPSVPTKPPLKHLLDKQDLKQKLRKLGGIPDEVLDTEELFDIFEPMLRADFQAVESWKYSTFPKLDLPVSVFAGTDDDIPEADLFAWRNEFVQDVHFQFIKGGHFYLFENEALFISALLDRLSDNR